MKDHDMVFSKKTLHSGIGKIVLCALALCWLSLAPALAQQNGSEQEIRLRSFAPGASGRLTISPDANGGRGRLTALGLPAPQETSISARIFLIWAIAPERAAVRIGQLQTDARGNGGLEFALPTALDRFSIIVTSEPVANAVAPTGAPVLSTRAREIAAQYRAETPDNARRAGADSGRAQSDRRRRRRAGATTNFYDEVNTAVDSNSSRMLELVGAEVTPDASGTARVAARESNAYARARFQRLTLPAGVAPIGNFFVLWAIASDGRVFYMGSLPNEHVNEAEVYVRVNGTRAESFTLAVTVEDMRPIIRPAGRRALSTRER